MGKVGTCTHPHRQSWRRHNGRQLSSTLRLLVYRTCGIAAGIVWSLRIVLACSGLSSTLAAPPQRVQRLERDVLSETSARRRLESLLDCDGSTLKGLSLPELEEWLVRGSHATAELCDSILPACNLGSFYSSGHRSGCAEQIMLHPMQ